MTNVTHLPHKISCNCLACCWLHHIHAYIHVYASGPNVYYCRYIYFFVHDHHGQEKKIHWNSNKNKRLRIFGFVSTRSNILRQTGSQKRKRKKYQRHNQYLIDDGAQKLYFDFFCQLPQCI